MKLELEVIKVESQTTTLFINYIFMIYILHKARFYHIKHH